MGVCWWVGDVPKLLVTSSRACCIGLATVGVVGRPGGGAGGDFFGIDLVDANGDACWHRCSMCVESSLNMVGVNVSSPARNCLMSMVGVFSSPNSIASSLAVDFIVGPCRILASSSRLAGPPDAPCKPHGLASHPCWWKNSSQLFTSWLSEATGMSL